MNFPRRMAILAALLASAWAFHASAALPRVDAQLDPAKSYWKEHVHYQYPVTMTKVADGSGRQWEIAYMDVYRGAPEKRAASPALVLLPGRGMTSAYWGEVMEKPLQEGMRVIAIDLPHAGKSLPGNLHLPVHRSLQDIRDVVFNLVVGQLGIKRAAYLGHSLGGQVALGYALQHPAHVDKLVLLGATGLEAAKAVTVRGVRLDDPAYADSYDKFREAWSRAGMLPDIGADAAAVEQSFHAPLRAGTRPYVKKGDPLGDYVVATRAQALKGNPQELERYRQVHGWEVYAILQEMRHDQPQSLHMRLNQLAMPVLAAYGLQESAFPTPGSGNSSFLWDVINPAYDKTRKNRAPFMIKLYDKAGHFLHLDLPQAFSADLMAFLKEGKVTGKLFAGDPDNYQPEPQAELATLPEDVAGFKKEAEAAFTSRDMAQMATMFHPEFRGERTLAQQLEWLSGLVPMFTQWQLAIFELEERGELLKAKIEYRTSLGNMPDEITLKRLDGKWKFYGGVPR